MTSHRAIVRNTSAVTVVERPTPVPGPGELCVAPLFAGLCGTDIQILRGLRGDPAPVIGHEGVARVVDSGPDVPPEYAPGTLVAVNPTSPNDPAFLLGHNVDGLLQERTLVPATAVRGGLVLPLPEGVDASLGPLLEPLATVRYALSVLSGVSQETLVVVGDGTVGHLAVRAARRWLDPVPFIVLVQRSAKRRSPGLTEGESADAVVEEGHLGDLSLRGPVGVLLATPRDSSVGALESILAATAGREVIVDMVGGLPEGAKISRLPGVDLAGVRAANLCGIPETPHIVEVAPGLRLFGHRGVSQQHLRDSAAELASAPHHYKDLITHEVDLYRAARIMQDLMHSRSRIVEGRRLIKLSVRISDERC